MAHLTISQPDGAGSYPQDTSAADLWVDTEIEIALTESASYKHFLLDRVDGSALAFSSDTPFSTAQIATLTPDEIGSYRGLSVAIDGNGVQTTFPWILRVQCDSAGGLVGDGIVAPSRGEIPSEAPETDGRGAATLMDRAIERIRNPEFRVDRLYARDGEGIGDQGSNLYIRPGRTQNDLHAGQPFGDAQCWANVIVEMGVAGRDTDGETSSVNFMYGDTRIATVQPFIAYEHGFYGVDGYNTDPASGVEATPHGWRTHTSTGIGYLLQGHRDVTIESVVGPVQTNVVAGQHIQEAYAVSGGGVYHRRRGFKGVTSGTTPLAINLGDLVPSAHMAHCRAYVACLPTDFSSFEVFAVKWAWFRSNVAASIIADFAGIGGYTAPGTRIPSPSDNSGPVNFNVVGLSGKTMTWEILLEYDFFY